MKKIAMILICSFFIVGLSGCDGSNYNKEYEKEINIVKKQTMPFTKDDVYSIGELLDNAFEDAYWDHYKDDAQDDKYVLISVKGKNKFDNKEYEVVYKVNKENDSVTLDQTYIDGKKDCCVTDVYRDSYKDIKGE